MKIFPKLSAVTLESHKNTIVFFVVTLVANLLPLLLGVLIAVVREKWSGLEPFYSGGEFYIYSAALLGSSCYIFYTLKKKNYDKLSLLFFLSGFIGLASSLLYALLIADKAQFSQAVLTPTSYGILTYAVFIYYYAELTDQRKGVNVGAQERKDIDDIKGELGGEQT